MNMKLISTTGCSLVSCPYFIMVTCIENGSSVLVFIKTHSSVSAAKKTKKDVQHTSVLFTGTAKLPNSAFCISKTTQPISTKFIYFMPYIYSTLHIKFEENRFSSS